MHLRLAPLFTLLAAALPAQVYRSAANATIDPALTAETTRFLSIPGVFTDFRRAGGGQFVELPNGTARLTCRVFSQSNLYSALLVDIELSGRIDPGDPGYPPANAPNLGLLPSAYTPNGPVDPATFSYYTTATGTLHGVRNFRGGLMTIAAVAPVQVGQGASNRNGDLGLFGEFSVNVVSNPSFYTFTPSANATLALDFVAPYDEDVTHPQVFVQQYTNLSEGRALEIPGVADDYVFVPTAGAFREQHDGTATLTGMLGRIDDLSDRWHLTVSLQGRVDPGEASHPPAGSPIQLLLPAAYTSNGGPIDPDHWHYYTVATGTLLGSGINDGGEIDLAQTSAVQVGGGANNTNTYSGCYGTFGATIVTQPTARTLAISGDVLLGSMNASFPVLPMPSLVVPASVPSHPTLTADGLVLEGDNLAWIQQGSVGPNVFSGGDPTRFVSGWLDVLDNQHVEIHPRPDTLPGPATVRLYNPAVPTNAITIDLVEPTAPVFVAEPTVGLTGVMHGRMHHGVILGPALALIGLSQTFAPSVFPGWVDLDIGNNFADLILDPTLYTFDPATNVATIDYGPITAGLLGSTYYLQGMVIDIGQGSPPFAETNYWQVDFQ